MADSRSSSPAESRGRPVLLSTNPDLAASRPLQKRRSSRLPGGFDTDDELSPMKMEFGEEARAEWRVQHDADGDRRDNDNNNGDGDGIDRDHSSLVFTSEDDDTTSTAPNPTPAAAGLAFLASPPALSPRQQPPLEAPYAADDSSLFLPPPPPPPPPGNELGLHSSSLLPPITPSRDRRRRNNTSNYAYNNNNNNNNNTSKNNNDTMDDSTHNNDHDTNNDDHDHDQSLPNPNQTALDEKEMRRQLLDMESSFLPEPSTIDVVATPGLPAPDDTYLVGLNAVPDSSQLEDLDSSRETPPSPSTPPGAYKTPAARRVTGLEPSLFEEGDTQQHRDGVDQDQDQDVTPSGNGNGNGNGDGDGMPNTSSLETISSSPTAAAAARTVSRVLSTTLSSSSLTSQRRQQAEREREDSLLSSTDDDGVDATPRRSRRDISTTRAASRNLQDSTGVSGSEGDTQHSSDPSSVRRRKRPKFLTSRQSVHRFSTSSVGTVNTETASSEAAMGVDYAIQSGGAAPANNSRQRSGSRGRPKNELARSISLGSMASGVSGMSDDNILERRGFSGVSEASLHTLDEEDSTSQARPGSSGKKSAADPMTPKAQPRDSTFQPETAIADHIKDIPIPPSLARQFRETTFGMSMSPDKRGGAPTPAFGRSGKSLTLKEQSSTIDRLSKENFDLKMRIHFLNEALNKRSEEGVKEMISENVELKSDKLKLQKDNQSLRKMVRELEKRIRDGKGGGGEGGEEGGETDGEERDGDDHGHGHGHGHGPTTVDEEELIYLRERIETYEVEIERLRSESISRESEKRRLAEMVKSLGDGRVAMGSDAGAREERDMWKDMLDAETAAREQAEEENRKLRDELLRMKPDVVSNSRSGGSRVGKMSSVVSRSTISDRDVDRSAALGTSSSATLVELELLKHENAELRREVSAQTSMLTSRNREKERLYQEIEDLKLGQRRADAGRSVAGDSIFERSISRAQDRSHSRTSDGTRSRASDAERESLEIKNGELRDQVSTLKLENQSIRAQLDECMTDLEALDRAYQADVEQAEDDLQNIQAERDQALQLAEEREEALQDLKTEAQEELDAMGDELDQKIDECQRMEVELSNQHENLKALQAEMRSASEGIIRLEEDAQNNLQKYKSVQQELDDANRELEAMEKSLFEANSKVQRLTVQQESSQNEIAFLREEQDGDKIKIGDLESELKTCQMSLQSEKDRAKELDRRLAEERHQREVVGSKEKQEVQRLMNELNREATAAKDEVRKLKKNLSSREIEATTWKERLMELENSLREALGDLNGTRSSLLTSITKLQQELDSTALELESTRTKLDEKESLLRNRDALLESHGLETRKLADLLERERQAHRADKHSFEQSLKSHHQASRTITQNNSRISDLEAARSQDRKRFNTLEQQYKDQLNERNAMFLNIWKRLSAMCGPDWAHSNSLINGNLPSQEVIGNMLFWPGFSRNLLLAVKTVENLIGGFKTRIKAVERDLTKEYQNLEHNLNIRVKKLERMEDTVQNLRISQHHHQRSASSNNTASPEISKLRGENRLLKAELNLLQSHSHARAANAAAAGATPGGPGGGQQAASRQSATNLAANTLSRYSSTTAVDNTSIAGSQHQAHRSPSTISRGSSGIPQPSHYSSSSTLNNNNNNNNNPTIGMQSSMTQYQPQHSSPRHSHTASEPSHDKWIQRLRELERRLKEEREARILDRSGARKRLEEQSARNQELERELARQKVRGQQGGAGGGRTRQLMSEDPRALGRRSYSDAPLSNTHSDRGGGDGDGDGELRSNSLGHGHGHGRRGHALSTSSVVHRGERERERVHSSHGRPHQQQHLSRNHGGAGGVVETDEYDGEDDYDDEDDGMGTGTGTDEMDMMEDGGSRSGSGSGSASVSGSGDGGGLTVEVEV
ncbi:Anucleate primary sterigmata protein B [Onygenales sp. PD_10]|nr:Anucleate primary sterigmata protein B [Onygenales sp. PD_10]